MRTRMAAATMLLASTQAVGQDDTRIVRMDDPSRITLQQPVTCSGTVPQGSEMVVLSTTGQAGPMVPFTVDANSASRIVSVTSGSGKATTLLLTSAAPVVWDLRGVAAGRVTSVVVSGRGTQGVVGLPASVPIEYSDSSGSGYMSGGQACRPLMPVNDLNTVVASAQIVRMRFGRYPDRLYAGRSAIAFDLDGADVRLPTTIDLKQADVRTQQPIDPQAPKPAAIMMKEMIDDGTLRFAGPSTMESIRSSITPISPQPSQMDRTQPNIPPNAPPEIRARIMESYRQTMLSRQESMARAMSYVPGSGIIVTRKVDVLPVARGGGQNAFFLPSDVPVPGTIPAGAKLYRIGMPVGQLPPKETNVDGMQNMLEGQYGRGEAGTVADMKVSWSQDVMSMRMPPMDPMNGSAASAASPSGPLAPERSDSTTWIVLAVLAVLAALGGAVWFIRRGAGSTSPRPAQGGSRLDSLEAMTKEPALKADVRTFREEAMRLVGREGMDKDLSDEANAVLRDRFGSIADRYMATRPTSEPEAAVALDAKLSESLRDMTQKLMAIRQKQDQRNVEALTV